MQGEGVPTHFILGERTTQNHMKPRIIVWFSCGGPSAVAGKMAVKHYGESHEVAIVNCDTRPSEHSDNYRFSQEVEAWLGRPITYISNPAYKTVDEVFEKTRYMSGIRGARCTTELKKAPRHEFAFPDDIHVFGFTFGERKRARDFTERNPELKLLWILIDLKMSKKDCMNELKRAGIQQPMMYELGFDNNNCPGCVKSKGKWYWDMIRTHFPEVFKRRCEQSRAIGCRLVAFKGKRIFLDELPSGPFNKPRKKENLSCGPECGTQIKLPI
jgi:hypothetical protein